MRIGLALSGGAVRGVFHIGVLQALEEMNVEIDTIAGTSSGAIVGALYQDGYSPEEILKIVKSASIFRMVRPKIWSGGLLTLKYLETLLKQNLRTKNIEDLPKRMMITGTNLNTGALDVFEDGPIIPAVIASSSIPIMFEAIKHKGSKYTDGGLLMNLPASPLKAHVDKIIGINLVPVVDLPMKELSGFLNMASRTFDLSVMGNIQPEIAYCDLVITLEALAKIGRFSFDKVDTLFKMGYQATMQEENNLKKLLGA